jgi:hypothetical protein
MIQRTLTTVEKTAEPRAGVKHPTSALTRIRFLERSDI